MKGCYRISVRFEDKEWPISKTSKDFDELFKYLLNFDKKFIRNLNKSGALVSPDVPNEYSISGEINHIKKHEYSDGLLADFIQNILKIPILCNDTQVLEFIELSAYSREQPIKRKEGYVEKRTGGRYGNEDRCLYVCKYCRRHQKRWLILTDVFVGYTTKSTNKNFHEVLMFKDNFEMWADEKSTGHADGILIKTLRRSFFFHAGSVSQKEIWAAEINELLKNSKAELETHLYGSSFPPRVANNAKWYVDGEEYFKDVYHELKSAKEQVFITDWWLSPEMYLLRPSVNHQDSQIVRILAELAERNVQIYIHMYKEVTLACTFNSLHSKEVLKKNIKKNIQIIRHPQRGIIGGSVYWSHHEKIICIDQTTAFFGGLDLCFGRWDTNSHSLSDESEPYIWNGIDYSNVRVKDFINVEDYENTPIERSSVPRMPWHDIGMRVKGIVANDLAIHFIELWNHVMTDITGHYHRNKKLIGGRSSTALKPVEKDVNHLNQAVIEETNEEDDVPRRELHEEEKNLLFNEEPTDFFNQKSHTIMIKPKQHKNSRIRRATSQEFLDTKTKVMRHQLQMEEAEKNYAILQEEAERKYETLQKSEEIKAPAQKNLLRRASALNSLIMHELNQDPLMKQSILGKFTEEEIQRRENEQLLREQADIAEENELKRQLEKDDGEASLQYMIKPLLSSSKQLLDSSYSSGCEVVRSASKWSYGLEKTESSIHQAYLSLIEESQHFIYIENQFFISSTAGTPVGNRIAEALVDRIKRAHQNNENFHVIVVMPLLPGFEGNVYDPSATVLKIQLNWEYLTISRGENSIIKQLLKLKINPSDYINFYGLRTHSFLGGVPVTEIVYVHSKMMIVDDDIAIIGSANINDRSMIGSHDSEIAMVVKDTDKVQSTMNGKPWLCSKFASTLRKKVFHEFLGDENINIEDPVSNNFKALWKETASYNTIAYRNVFKCYPDNIYTTLADIVKEEKASKVANISEFIERYQAEFSGSKGTLVEFPLNFLSEEKLGVSFFSKENLLSDLSFI